MYNWQDPPSPFNSSFPREPWPASSYSVFFSHLFQDGGGGHWLVRMEWCPAGWSVCLPLLIFPCTFKSRSSLLAPAHPGRPGKRAVKRLWCGGSRTELLDKWHRLFMDVLPVTQPTVSKHWRKPKALTPASGPASSFPHLGC